MSSKKRLLAIAMAAALLLTTVVPASAAAAAGNDSVANDALAVAINDAGNDGATVTVTHEGSAVPGAAVSVAATDDNATYAGAGQYTAGNDGTVSLPEPEREVTVAVTAAKGNLSGAATATLTVAADEPENFGGMVSSFVHEMLSAGGEDGAIGQAVSEFVTSNNPGNAPDHAGGPDEKGKPAHAGGPDNANKSDKAGGPDEKGKPAHAGNGDADDGAANDTEEKGKPAHAGNADGDDANATDDADDEEKPAEGGNGGSDDGDDSDDDSDDDDKRGNGKSKANGKGR